MDRGALPFWEKTRLTSCISWIMYLSPTGDTSTDGWQCLDTVQLKVIVFMHGRLRSKDKDSLLMPLTRPQKMFGDQMINCETLLKSETGHDRSFYWKICFYAAYDWSCGKQMVNGLHSTLKIIFGFPPWPKRAGLEESPRACAWSCKRPAKLSRQRCVTTIFDSSCGWVVKTDASLRLQPAKADGGWSRVLQRMFWFILSFIGSLHIVRMYRGRVVL